jgi:dihydrofolate synthase/folylpolyglutamate synthase
VQALGRPDRAYASIVVAGTNGKGSVVAMAERGLRAAGYRTGRFTSPHLVRLEERFAIDGTPIDGARLEELTARVRSAANALPAPPTFFEATTALALEAFRDAAVDIAVLEVGLGGRLDATNVVHPVAVAITAIDFDHQELLGDTIEAIAREKAGVIKRGAVTVLAPNPPAVHEIVQDVCAGAGARFVAAQEGLDVRAEMTHGQARVSLTSPRGRYQDMTLALRGRHQVDNAITVVRLLEELPGLKPRPTSGITPAAIRAAVEDVIWPGRLQLVRWRGGDVLVDGAHNPAGARALASYVTETYGQRLPFVVGILRDKPVAAILAELGPVASHFVLTAPTTSRAATVAELAAAARSLPHLDAEIVGADGTLDPIEALDRATALGNPVVVAGSLYLAGDVLAEVS